MQIKKRVKFFFSNSKKHFSNIDLLSVNYVTTIIMSNKLITPSKKFNEQIVNNINKKFLINVKKKFDWWLILTIPSQEANLLPPIGPYLGQHGFNTINFCNEFNELTKIFEKGIPLKIIIKLFTDKSIFFFIKTVPIQYLILCVLINNTITTLDIFKIALIKKIELSHLSLISISNMVVGTLKSMFISIKD